eukprot:6211875-Pleurochrysis_carterae.AAC.3
MLVLDGVQSGINLRIATSYKLSAFRAVPGVAEVLFSRFNTSSSRRASMPCVAKSSAKCAKLKVHVIVLVHAAPRMRMD